MAYSDGKDPKITYFDEQGEGFSKQLDELEEIHEKQDQQRLEYFKDRPGPGRPPGSRNKTRPGFREMTYEVLNSVEMGGLQGYINWAVTHKSDFYGRLCPKLFGGEFHMMINNIQAEPVTFSFKVPIKAIDLAPANDGPTDSRIIEPNPVPALDPNYRGK